MLDNIFLDMMPKAINNRRKEDKWDFIKIKNICFKGHDQGMRTTHRLKENINYISAKGFVSGMQ